MPAVVPRREDDLSLRDVALLLARHLPLLIAGPIAVGLAVLGASYLVAPTYTARTTFLTPQQQQSALASSFAALGDSISLVSAGGPAEQYLTLLRSATIQDRLVDRFDLMAVYEAKYRFQARRSLNGRLHVGLGKKDGVITVEVDDTDPQRAADLANAHVDELRHLTSKLAITEAQQRRLFFEQELARSTTRLVEAQHALQASGLTQAAIKAEPKAAAESFARLRADVTAAEVRLQTLRSYLSETAPEVQRQVATLAALRAQVARSGQPDDPQPGPDYVSKYRDFKYEETLFDLLSRQYEAARLDESREGVPIQVIDEAVRPEWKSKPRRGFLATGATLVSAVLLLVFVLARHAWRQAAQAPGELADRPGQAAP
jgi:uncharacterized protein involved in exopolysaccharide biosynthesis